MIKQLVLAVALSCLGGLLFFYQESWLIINIPTMQQATAHHTAAQKKSKLITLYLWHKGSFKTESCEILITHDQAQTIQQVVHHFFTTYEEMTNSDQQVTVQSVILSPSEKQAFISLNQNPFSDQASTFEKLMLIKSLLKTLAQADLTITHIRLLVQHHDLPDYHLNFKVAWPLSSPD